MIDSRIDTVSIQRAEKLHPRIKLIVFECLSKCIDMKVPIRIVQGLRTIYEQNTLYAHGRTWEELSKAGLSFVIANPGLPKVTNAKGGDSWHNYGLSIDFVLLRGEKQISWNRQEDLDNDGQKDWNEVVDLFILKEFKFSFVCHGFSVLNANRITGVHFAGDRMFLSAIGFLMYRF